MTASDKDKKKSPIMDDREIEQYLRGIKPQVKDDPLFLLEASNRMMAVEGIKGEVDRQRRSGQVALVIALVVGLLVGGTISAIILLYPQGTISLQGKVLADISQIPQWWKYLFFALTPIFAIILGLVLSSPGKKVIG